MLPSDLSSVEQRALDDSYRESTQQLTDLQAQAHCRGFEEGWVACHLWLGARVVFEGELDS